MRLDCTGLRETCKRSAFSDLWIDYTSAKIELRVFIYENYRVCIAFHLLCHVLSDVSKADQYPLGLREIRVVPLPANQSHSRRHVSYFGVEVTGIAIGCNVGRRLQSQIPAKPTAGVITYLIVFRVQKIFFWIAVS
jgi:hypothetical protein